MSLYPTSMQRGVLRGELKSLNFTKNKSKKK